ncbi:ABC transporter substrate-binding protein [Paramicrobacterium fandaimingii]|uniref:ABC transporter substrate-binding protein n=1 Tax=Paramicrobacterium fandaimingii TaxID=2708079 RepID=UPI0014205785|nr:ABC transporter substrate-binding protein [Microbacterium fandaimingii]
MKLTKRNGLLAAAALSASTLLLVTGCSSGGGGGDSGNKEITIGVLTTDTGTYAFGMDETKAAIGAAMSNFDGDMNGGTVGDVTVKFIYEGTDGTPGSAQSKVKKLVENEAVDIELGPLSGDAGETIAQYATTVPEVTFVNGAASPVSMTLLGAENFYRFHGDAAMWMGGVGDYAFNELGYKNIYLLADDYSFPYDNAGGFFSEYCAAGGTITGASWVPLGTTDYATVLTKIPENTDAVYAGLGGADAAGFLSQAVSAGLDVPLVGGSIAVDTTALGAKADIAVAAEGMISGSPVPGAGYDNPEWAKFNEAYAAQPNAEFDAPTIFSMLYYNSVMPILNAIESTEGDLGDNQSAFRDALSATKWMGPTGEITVDENNQAIVDNFIVEVVAGNDGTLTVKNVSETKGVTQESTKSYERFSSCDDLQ